MHDGRDSWSQDRGCCGCGKFVAGGGDVGGECGRWEWGVFAGCFGAGVGGDAYSDDDGDGYFDRDAHGYVYSFCDADGDADGDFYAYTYGDENGDADFDGNSFTNANKNADGYCDADEECSVGVRYLCVRCV